MENNQLRAVGALDPVLKLERVPVAGVAPAGSHHGALLRRHPFQIVQAVVLGFFIGRQRCQAEQLAQATGQSDAAVGKVDFKRTGTAQRFGSRQHPSAPFGTAQSLLRVGDVDHRHQVGRCAVVLDAATADPGIEDSPVHAAAADFVRFALLAGKTLPDVLVNARAVFGNDVVERRRTDHLGDGAAEYFGKCPVGKTDQTPLRHEHAELRLFGQAEAQAWQQAPGASGDLTQVFRYDFHLFSIRSLLVGLGRSLAFTVQSSPKQWREHSGNMARTPRDSGPCATTALSQAEQAGVSSPFSQGVPRIREIRSRRRDGTGEISTSHWILDQCRHTTQERSHGRIPIAARPIFTPASPTMTQRQPWSGCAGHSALASGSSLPAQATGSSTPNSVSAPARS